MTIRTSIYISISYIEFGEQKTPSFIDWLKQYASLVGVGVTPEELWELRNGILHMTNLNSRQVARRKVRRVSVLIGGRGETDTDGTYYFDFLNLIQALTLALEKWFASYNSKRKKLATFIEQYDEAISDSRLFWKPKPADVH